MKPPSEYWRNFWNEEARHATSDYALNRRTTLHVEGLEERALGQFLRDVDPRPGDVVLDAGCGSGRNISIISPLVKEVVGLDYSEQMLHRASERLSGENLQNVRLVPGDITNLQFPSHSFDKVICASVLQYLDDEDCALAIGEMVRVSKPGGRLVLHVKNGTSLYALSLKILRSVATLIGRRVKPEYYRARTWHEAVAREAGGSVIDYDGFGILTFVPLPKWAVSALLRFELRCIKVKALRRFAVNYKMTIRINDLLSSSQRA